MRAHWLGSLGFAVLLAALAPAAAEPPPDRLEPGLARALGRALPAEGIAVVVRLTSDAMPAGPARAGAIHSAQQRVLDALPKNSFRLKHRYAQIAGLAAWAQRGAIDALASHPDVALVYLDRRVSRALAEGVPLVGGATAHAKGYTGAGITVAVIDSGIDAAHPDLADDLVAQQCFCDDNPSPSRGCCPNGRQTQSGPGAAAETDGHGTSVSGIITSGGVVAAPGIAPDAGIAAIRVFGATGGGRFSDIDAALDWVLANRTALGIRVVNMSLGDSIQYANSSVFPCSGSNTADAVSSLASAGLAVFVASGNEGFDAGISFPACIGDAISVGGVYDADVGPTSWCGNSQCSTILCTDNPTSADKFVCHANSGTNLDLLAPDWRTDAPQAGGGTHGFGGTSAACPYAAGEAAVLLQAQPGLTPAALRTLMKAHGPLVTNPQSGLSFRRTDVAAALATLIDSDGDGLTDAAEASLGTNPDNPDTDGDGLSDGAEVNTRGTNPLLADSDGDGLADGAEVNTYLTDPLRADTDGDGFSDGAEVAAGSDPRDPGSVPHSIPAIGRWQGIALAALLLAFGRRAGRRDREL
ncbi:MAG TPA: S8 family serine peptidase [Myxococcota bacterium]|nr:S8 family serine peptidase [Myxococcota bacterium]